MMLMQFLPILLKSLKASKEMNNQKMIKKKTVKNQKQDSQSLKG